MAFLIALALALPALGEISVDASLGWGGVAVLGRVNPLWVTVKNPSGASVVGTLEVEWQIGSPWRGRAERCLSAPVVLAPRGQAKLLFPCPVERGTRELSIKVLSGSTPLATASLPVSPAAAPLSGSAGGMAQGVILAPQDLTDPLLLHPFGKIKATTPLPAEAQEALLSWAAFLGGELSGLPPPTPWEWPDRDDLSQAFSRLSLPHPPLAPLALAVATYLLGIGFFLPPAAHGRFRPLTISLTVTWGLSLFSSVLYEPVSGTISCRWILRDDTVGRFGLEFTTLTSIRVGEWRGEGVWVEFLPGEEGGWEGRDLWWEWGGEGVETVVSLQPGAVRVLWRLSKGEPEGGEEFRWQNELVRLRDGRRGELTTLISPTFQPLWEVVYPRLSPGERLWARAERVQRNGELEWELMLEVEGAE